MSLTTAAPLADPYVTPLGDRREHPVRCSTCRTDTWRLDGRCTPCAGKAMRRTARLLDEALVDAVAELDPHPMRLHAAVLERLEFSSSRVAKTAAAALYAASLHANEGDALAAAVVAVQDAQGDLDEQVVQFHEDEPCVQGADGCSVCQTVREDHLEDALADLRAVLGARAVADLIAAVTS